MQLSSREMMQPRNKAGTGVAGGPGLMGRVAGSAVKEAG